jgi:hypothetical protein
MTWFRREPDVTWFNGFGHDAGIQRAAMDEIRSAGAFANTGRNTTNLSS